jgi:superfamily I DNA/RNA helicase
MSEAEELNAAVNKVLESKSRKKLVVAGPGAGKTTLFKKLLEITAGSRDDRLVLTFINTLKDDLDRSLGANSLVNTLHGYCLSLLYSNAALRKGLTDKFICYPELVSFIKQDWAWLKNEPSPTFVDRFRNLDIPDTLETFYMERAQYYDAVDFDDTVFRVYRGLEADGALIPSYRLILVDEFQDFNKMEAGVIRLLSSVSPIVIAGDDDQALYSQLRSADWSHIRGHHGGGEFEVFELPFCMRCPEVVVRAVNKIVEVAKKLGKLSGRISKPFRYFEPAKGEDSRRFPRINLVRVSVQRGNANYFGRYIAERIEAISEAERKIAAEKFEPAALIIGSKPYLPQVEAFFIERGLYTAPPNEKPTERQKALEILHKDSGSNIGWRIILGLSRESVAKPIVRTAAENKAQLADAIEPALREAVLKEAAQFAAIQAAEAEGEEDKKEADVPAVKLTSFEGSKGLSAQYVFIVGLHEGDIPRTMPPQDLEICKFLVGLTRTKKECTILIAKNFAGEFKKPSPFIDWIADCLRVIDVDAKFWKK